MVYNDNFGIEKNISFLKAQLRYWTEMFDIDHVLEYRCSTKKKTYFQTSRPYIITISVGCDYAFIIVCNTFGSVGQT